MATKDEWVGRDRELRSVIVGVVDASGEVYRIRVQKNGLIVDGGTVHCPPEGRSAFLEALHVSGLVHAREFLSGQLEEAAIYAEELMQNPPQYEG